MTASQGGTGERVTAAVMIIGDEILSGRTQDVNLAAIARYLATYGVDLCEAMASAAGCDDLRSARRLFVASGVTLGVALAATALFAGLRVRHARRARVSAAWRGVAVHF